jgi:DNA-binding transcriptional regulator YbjK
MTTLTREQAEAIIGAACSLLSKLDQMTLMEYAYASDRPERETLRRLLAQALNCPLYAVTDHQKG